jgi:hypothetical protein
MTTANSSHTGMMALLGMVNTLLCVEYIDSTSEVFHGVKSVTPEFLIICSDLKERISDAKKKMDSYNNDIKCMQSNPRYFNLCMRWESLYSDCNFTLGILEKYL